MKVIFIALLFLFSFVNISLADEGNKPKMTSVTGVVVDKVTGEPLEGVKLVIKDTNEVIYTDSMGGFQFEKEAAKNVNFTVELISYEKLTVDSKSIMDIAQSDIVLSMSEVD